MSVELVILGRALRDFILDVIAERTMPREYAAPDDNWLMPYYRIAEDRDLLIKHLDAVQSEIEALKQRIVMLEKKAW